MDDEGRNRDYGHSIFEGAEFTCDGTRDGYDIGRIQQIAALLEHAPDLFDLARKLTEVTGKDLQGATNREPVDRLRQRAEQILYRITYGETKYR